MGERELRGGGATREKQHTKITSYQEVIYIIIYNARLIRKLLPLHFKLILLVPHLIWRVCLFLEKESLLRFPTYFPLGGLDRIFVSDIARWIDICQVYY